MKIDSTKITQLVLCIFVLLLFSCSGKTDNSVRKQNEDITPLSCVVLLPPEIPLDDPTVDAAHKESLRQGAEFFLATLKSELSKSQLDEVIDMSGLNLQINEVSGGKSGIVRVIGENSQCNNVLLTNLDKYLQRQGSELAIDSPASAEFGMRLMQADTGHSLWSVSFSETQESLLSNLFSFSKAQSRGFKWITVEQLVEQAVHEKLMDCPYFF